MSTNPSGNQPPYPNQQPTSQYPPAMFNYGSSAVGYPPPSNQAAYPPPVETVPYNAPYPATAPPPSYESAVGGGKSEKTPGNSSYQSQPFPAAPMTSYPTYPSSYPDVEYGQTDASHFSEIISFNDKSIRLGFIRRVFAVLMLQLATTVGAICLFIFNHNVKNFAQNNWAMYTSAYVVFFVLYFVLVCCEGVRRSYPANVIMLSLFTLSLSYLVAVISSFHETNIVLIMMGVTTLVCASVMIFACQTKYDFTTWGGVLFCAALAIFFLSIFTPLWLALSTTFLAYDVQLVMGGKKYELSPEEYIFASLILYMDIIRIFLLLLAIFGRGSN
ncbi:hypothetical protein pdam_00009647 [Pocillopora damicornis]|uniref:Uncharacterized protein n=1 Tax=Pocillopora damicornis TaxID=46731 RepID=A0A3M6UAC8_POCDA|nr:hypothetical protein pdam_00009647 [Pocillopora damicornis]